MARRPHLASLLCFGLAFLLACADQYTSPDRTQDRGPVELTEFLRLGDEAQGDTVLFGSISSMAVNSAGQVVVGDRDAAKVYVYSPDGQLASHFGGKGAGPGEFEWLGRVAVGPRDSVFAFDWQLRRISAFAPDTYQFAYSLTLVEGSGDQTPYDLVGVAEQGFILRFAVTTNLSTQPVPEADELRIAPVMRVNRRGEPVDSLVGLRVSSPIFASDGSRIIPRPFARHSVARLGPEGVLYSGWSDAVHIDMTAVSGQPLGSLHVPHDPVAVTQEDMDAVMEARDHVGRQMILDANLAGAKPAFQTLVVDDGGRVWVQLSAATGAPAGRWLIIGLEGSVDGEVELPVNVTLMAVRAGRAYGELEDAESGAPLVVGYEIIEP